MIFKTRSVLIITQGRCDRTDGPTGKVPEEKERRPLLYTGCWAIPGDLGQRAAQPQQGL